VDFSSLNLPSRATPYSLGIAQIEELVDAINNLKAAKLLKQLVTDNPNLSKQLQLFNGDDATKMTDFKSLVEGNPNPELLKKIAHDQELLQNKVEELKDKSGFRTIAFADAFTSQGQYLLASAFDEVSDLIT
jgi:hypothetical protein